MRKWMQILPALMAALVLAAGSGCAATGMQGRGQPRMYEVVEPDGTVRYLVEHNDEILVLAPEDLARGAGGESGAALIRLFGWLFFWFFMVWIEILTEYREVPYGDCYD
jgi:hypothetical protein